ncbi:helix-turn-helix domain-containing protein [Streptomyces roseoverticillatus]|uniref:helix-turn-helix domain-containing protein n=1 Tax=Streptomyces roseoverticillatus TaxID=66429 RepID=UPI0004C2054D|nr:helix-turn-helix transcriptional regulator [Streptomyces roseoverticillatus]
MGSDVGAGDLADLLRELKERSGLSYGVLAKRLHVSTSTLHRYCSGAAVPAEFAPVERLARLCKATPEELMEVHRRWIVADATRGRKQQAEPAAKAEAGGSAAPEEPPAGERAESREGAEPEEEPAPGEAPVAPPVAPSEQSAAPQRRRLPRRTALAALAAAATVTVLGSAALAVTLSGGGSNGGGSGSGDDRRGRIVEAASPGTGKTHASGKPGTGGSSSPSAGPSPSQSREQESGKGSASPSPGNGPEPEPETGGGKGPGKPAGVPLTAHVRPHAYEDPCTQHYLVDRSPGGVPLPPSEPDAPGWVSRVGAVPAGEQYVKITLQGTGKETVVLEGLQVRVEDTKPPLAWNDYATGVGCGGDVATRSFGVDLDSARPAAAPRDGQRDFPYKVSETDPEVFYVKAAARRHDVTWYLEVQWSSGGRRGVLRIDDQGRPFRTSGAEGRPAYQWPPGGAGWEPAPRGD